MEKNLAGEDITDFLIYATYKVDLNGMLNINY